MLVARAGTQRVHRNIAKSELAITFIRPETPSEAYGQQHHELGAERLSIADHERAPCIHGISSRSTLTCLQREQLKPPGHQAESARSERRAPTFQGNAHQADTNCVP